MRQEIKKEVFYWLILRTFKNILWMLVMNAEFDRFSRTCLYMPIVFLTRRNALLEKTMMCISTPNGLVARTYAMKIVHEDICILAKQVLAGV